MNWKRYQNEFIVIITLLIMLFAYIYKHSHVSGETAEASTVQRSIDELKEAVALKKIWGDKALNKKVNSLRSVVSSSKVKWKHEEKSVEAYYKGLGANELNKLTKVMLNMPIEIELLKIKKVDTLYDVELKCKW